KVPAEHASEFAGTILSATTTLTMIRQGWKVKCKPGDPVLLTKGGQSFDAFKLIHELTAKKITPEAFVTQMEGVGMADVAVG
ncbi:MAG TPA: hypothetical protein VEJ63_13815, partial [Planctomycetota bacterium]|nr:hypothetical protein [Planctomycetota bacterium]